MKEEFPVSVNGVEKSLPLSTESSFGDLLSFLRTHYTSEGSCISAIRVDGQEISERDEASISPLPLSNLAKVEIFTAHPRELAEETLQNLLAFTDHLIVLSQRAGTMFKNDEHPSLELAKLFDGIQTFTDALDGAKQVLRAGQMNTVQVLEMDLLSVMQDLLESYHQSRKDYLIDLLTTHLPTNMADWRDQGLPAIIRSRDS